MAELKFNDDMIQRHDLPKDVFELIHDLCYHVETRDIAAYVGRAKGILTRQSLSYEIKSGAIKIWLYDLLSQQLPCKQSAMMIANAVAASLTERINEALKNDIRAERTT